ncbi:MAG: restriction endonuclease [bacterium]|nr:restriction endonuclease [bacterium]MDE0289582.1 restriction endonuclease [bacterium]MDE0440414.1 restriction endonuclease [bacterium]
MSNAVPQAILDLLGWRSVKSKFSIDGKVPNVADKDSRPSVEIAAAVFDQLEVTRSTGAPGQTAGSRFEKAIEQILEERLWQLVPNGKWTTDRRDVTDFAQYEHLARIQLIAEANPTLRSSLGTDYLIKPDVTIGIKIGPRRHLHAAVSCKWTIRSDRVQNIRHEGVVLTRHRRGRQPHFVAVTAEPLPSRLAAIARGTGELDCVYHVALQQLRAACQNNRRALNTLEELIAQDRLRSLGDLPEVIARY